jgi:hypothetical protein
VRGQICQRYVLAEVLLANLSAGWSFFYFLIESFPCREIRPPSQQVCQDGGGDPLHSRSTVCFWGQHRGNSQTSLENSPSSRVFDGKRRAIPAATYPPQATQANPVQTLRSRPIDPLKALPGPRFAECPK